MKEFIPMDKKAKGKTNVFKFVALRNPEKPDSESLSRSFVVHPAIESSAFVTEGSDIHKKSNLTDLKKLSAEFTSIETIKEIDGVTPALVEFADWLSRNKKSIDESTVNIKAEGLEPLAEETLLNVWDQLFYFIIENKSEYLREELLKLIIANHFIENKGDEKLVTADKELQLLAKASVVIPKVVLAKANKKAPANVDTYGPQITNFIDAEELEKKMLLYKEAIHELGKINRNYNTSLSSAKIDLPEDLPELEEGTEVSVSNEDITTLKANVANPLLKENLTVKVSENTLKVADELNLYVEKDPVSAIQLIEHAMKDAQRDILSTKKLYSKTIVAGGSIIELNKSGIDPNAGFTQGCMPQINDAVGIDVNETANYIQATTSGFGNSGGGSVEKIDTYGSISFALRKSFMPGPSFFVGFSPSNLDADASSIKYSFKIEGQFVSGSYALKVTPYKNGIAFEDSFTCHGADEFRISRMAYPSGAKILWHRYRPSTNLISTIAQEDDESGDTLEPLHLDFAFSMKGQSIFDVKMTPCEGVDTDVEDKACQGIVNLGVADYMRVEQEICCYTAGEVSHIENILQGESKLRTTRRLRRQETTVTFESEVTEESLQDTTTTGRYEMKQATTEVLTEDNKKSLGVDLSASKLGPFKMDIKSSFSTSSSSSVTNENSVEYSKELLARAMEKVVTRVREERETKIVEEFEENNSHGLDNSNNSDGHVTGIYRWVDKIYNNQVVNYGRKLTYEFMIPEPAKFHLWAMATEETGLGLEKPEDPRDNGLESHSDINEGNYDIWAASFGLKTSPPPARYKEVGKAFTKDREELDKPNFYAVSYNDFSIPEGYTAYSAVLGMHWWRNSHPHYFLSVAIGNQRALDNDYTNPAPTIPGFYELNDIEGSLPISFSTNHVRSFHANVVVKCERKPEVMEAWRIDTYNKIISAYKEQKRVYDNALEEAKAQASLGIQIKGNNPRYNRAIEEQELKKLCMKWLQANFGAGFYNEISPCSTVEGMPNLQTTEELACYNNQAKFFEQAFDWDLMSYLFYPYFWGEKCGWNEIYRLDDNDPIFRAFLQAGMARVVVPVKENYETSVIYYLETGQIWNGGEVPVPGDPLYESIVDDLILDESTAVGDPWETRVPTSLNILQSSSSPVDQDGLPCNCDDYEPEGTGSSSLEGDSDGGLGKFEIS